MSARAKLCLSAVIVLSALLTVGVASAWAAAPDSVNYMGILKTPAGTPVADGNYSVTFNIYDVASGPDAALWSETQSVSTSGGLFSTLLGSVTPLTASVFSGPNRFLGITVNGDPEMSPRMPLVSVPFSSRVKTIDGAAGGTISDSLAVAGMLHITSGGLKFPDGTTQFTQAGAANGLPEGGGTMTGPIVSVGDPPITMGKGNFGTGNVNTGVNAFAAGENNTASGDYSGVASGFGNVATGENSDTTSSEEIYDTTETGFAQFTSTQTATGDFAFIGGGVDNHADGAVSVVGGGKENWARYPGGAVLGGYKNQALRTYGVIVGGYYNQSQGEKSFIGGGFHNRAYRHLTTIGGGWYNRAGDPQSLSGYYSTIGGGIWNVAYGDSSAVLGGTSNFATGASSSIGGGARNNASGMYATVPGGVENNAVGSASLAVGQRAKAEHDNTFVWNDGTPSDFASTNTNQFLIRAANGVGIGEAPASGTALDVAGTVEMNGFRMLTDPLPQPGYVLTTDGNGNGTWQAGGGSGGGGWVDAGAAVHLQTGTDLVGIGTSSPTSQLDVAGTVTMSRFRLHEPVAYAGHVLTSDEAGYGSWKPIDAWSLAGNSGTTPATNFLGTTDDQVLEIKVNNRRALRLEPNTVSPNLIGGHPNNSVTDGSYGSVIGGGGSMPVSSGGNRITGNFGVIGGGGGNEISAAKQYATIAGGQVNEVSGDLATIGGGSGNLASGQYSVIPGGQMNEASGDNSFAAGKSAMALHSQSFVWNGAGADFTSTADHQFLIQAPGGVGIGTNSPSAQLDVIGMAKVNNIRITSGAGLGRVLTSDGSGLGTWQTPANGDITGVTAGLGLTGDASSGEATLNVGAGAGISVAADAISVANNSVTSAMIADGTIAFGDIASNGAADGQIMKWNGSAWALAADQIGAGGDITGVIAGNGLTEGGMAGDVTIDIDSAWVDSFIDSSDVRYADSAGLADSTDAITDGGVDFADIGQNDATHGQIIKWHQGQGRWVADEDDIGSGDITGVTAGAGLTGGETEGDATLDIGAGAGISVTADAIAVADGGVTTDMIADATIAFADIGPNDATNGQIMKWVDGTGWTAAADNAGGWVDGTTAVHLQTETDKVGIGTDNPSEQLEITGNLQLPLSTESAGVIKMAGSRFIHNFGTENTFIGFWAGNLAMTGTGGNTAIGHRALEDNSTGFRNTASGSVALASNTTGHNNAASGYRALQSNTTGSNNTASGPYSLTLNTEGTGNTAMGTGALMANLIGTYNTAIGYQADTFNTTGSYNIAIGYRARTYPGDLRYATAIGAHAEVTANNCMVLGGTGAYAVNVGIGVTAPARRLHVSDVMRLEPRPDPPSDPQAGDMYIDSSNGNKLKVYDGDVWQACW